jgi:hypothetical protein
MEELADSVNSGRSYSGTYFKLTRDLTGANDTVTTAVGNDYYYFSGIFDGDGHEIAVNRVGIFALIMRAVVKNLGMCGYVTTYARGPSPYSYYIGGICGSAEQSDILNCWNSASIALDVPFTTSSSSSLYVGGICGTAFGVNIFNCYNTGSFFSSYPTFSQIGGICGGATNYTSISGCYNTGDISASSIVSYDSSVGGICGQFDFLEIANCFTANAHLTSDGDWGDVKTGRIVGDNGGMLRNNYALADILISGAPLTSNNPNSQDGQDTPLSNLQSQAWLQTNLAWDFQNTWEMSDPNDPIHKGLPILKAMNKGAGIPTPKPKEPLITLFPNPAQDRLLLSSETPIKKVEIYSPSGICIAIKEKVDNSINLSNLPRGIYLIRIHTDKSSTTKRLIKN